MFALPFFFGFFAPKAFFLSKRFSVLVVLKFSRGWTGRQGVLLRDSHRGFTGCLVQEPCPLLHLCRMAIILVWGWQVDSFMRLARVSGMHSLWPSLLHADMLELKPLHTMPSCIIWKKETHRNLQRALTCEFHKANKDRWLLSSCAGIAFHEDGGTALGLEFPQQILSVSAVNPNCMIDHKHQRTLSDLCQKKV